MSHRLWEPGDFQPLENRRSEVPEGRVEHTSKRGRVPGSGKRYRVVIVVTEPLGKPAFPACVLRVRHKPGRSISPGLKCLREGQPTLVQSTVRVHAELERVPASENRGVGRKGPRCRGKGSVENRAALSEALELRCSAR